MSAHGRRLFLWSVMLACQESFVGVSGAMIGGAVTLRALQAQSTVSERVGIAESRLTNHDDEIRTLRAQVESLTGKIDTMEGIGIGLGSIAIVIKVIEGIVKNRLRISE